MKPTFSRETQYQYALENIIDYSLALMDRAESLQLHFDETLDTHIEASLRLEALLKEACEFFEGVEDDEEIL